MSILIIIPESQVKVDHIYFDVMEKFPFKLMELFTRVEFENIKKVSSEKYLKVSQDFFQIISNMQMKTSANQ